MPTVNPIQLLQDAQVRVRNQAFNYGATDGHLYYRRCLDAITTLGHVAAYLRDAEQEPCIPSLESVRETELSLPQLACPDQPFTLTAPRETEETQTSLF